MSKYFESIAGKITLSQKNGHALSISHEFQILSSVILSRCTFLQSLVQQIIYTSHGEDLIGAKKALKDFPNPKARIDFLCSYPYSESDPIIAKVFDFSRIMFGEMYELRNVLADEVWSSSEEYPDAVLFSGLDENSRLLMASGKLWHKEDCDPIEVFKANVRFINSVKVVKKDHLHLAVRDMDICNWALMHILNVLNEDDPQRRDEARRAFLVFRGTSHLFDNLPAQLEPVEFSASRRKEITDNAAP